MTKPDATNPVTLVSGLRIRPGQEAAHARLHDRGIEIARDVAGLTHSELVPAVPGVQDETVALMTFPSRAALDRWLASPEREQVLTAMAALADSERTLNVIGGFPGWFPGPTAVKPWKQALTVLVGLIPVSYAVTELRVLLVPDLPLPVVIVITAVVNVSALTWIVMPRLNAWFKPWLTS